MLRKILSVSVVTLIIGLPLQLCGAAGLPELRPINQAYYKAPGVIKPGQCESKVFWLQTPHNNDAILIELNDPQDSIPEIAIDGLANFHYISTEMDQNSSKYIAVPSGLYYWKKQASIKVRPTDPSYYTYSPQTEEFIYAQRKAAFNPFMRPEVFQKFRQKMQFIQKYLDDPVNNTWHPFDQKWINTLTTNAGQVVHHAAAALPLPKGAALVQPLAKETITIASSNVLSESLYKAWFNKNINRKANILPLANRQKLFNAAFRNSLQLEAKDFIMMQEHPHGQIEGGLNTPKGTNYFSLKYGLLRNGAITDIVYKTGSADLYYNSKKFIPKTPIFDSSVNAKNIANGRYLGAIFEFIDHPGCYIGIVSAHIQWGKPKQVQQLLSDIDAVAQPYPAMGWIIAGDFNMNYNQPQSKSTQEGLGYLKAAGFIDSGVGTTAQNKRFTALGKVEQSPQNYITLMEGIDYIFYKNLHLTTGNTYPEIDQFPDRLLTSGHPWNNGAATSDRDRTFYSDHAIIGAEFDYAIAQPAKKQVLQPQAPQQTPVKKGNEETEYPLFDIFGGI
ncbi:MAG TPA: endonuclease/exonuclease/phosphatase family protein [Candidatus Babeliales bacterium]|nr:endonuclease/exonuclease/phosphatase family protein [Candidatus Babeliales bacterium]